MSNIHESSFKEKLTLSPIEKYITYNKFPWKFTLTILLIFLTTFQVILLLGPESSHPREQLRVIKNLIMGYSDDQTNVTLPLYTISDVQWHFQQLFGIYSTLDSELFQDVNLEDSELILTTYPTAIPTYPWNDPFHPTRNQTILDINGQIPPFFSDPSNITEFFKGISYFNITLTNLVTTVNQSLSSNSTQIEFCSNWTLTTIYNIQSFSSIMVTVDAQCETCGSKSNDLLIIQYEPNFLFLQIAVLICALASLSLTAKYLFKVAAVYKGAKALYKKIKKESQKSKASAVKLKEEFMEQRDLLLQNSRTDAGDVNKIFEGQVDWEDLPISEKIKFFDMWFVCRIVANAFQIMGATCCIIDLTSNSRSLNVIYGYRTFIGLGCFFAWLQILSYLEYSRGITLITTTLKNSLINTYVLLGISLPTVFAFVLLGMSIYSRYNEFITPGWGLTTLFALSLGDSVHQTFLNLLDEGYLMQTYLFIYMILFYTAIQNIFVAIVMEGYEMSTLRKQLDNNDPFPDIKKANVQALSSFGPGNSFGFNNNNNSDIDASSNKKKANYSFQTDDYEKDSNMSRISLIDNESNNELLKTPTAKPKSPSTVAKQTPRRLFKAKTTILPDTNEEQIEFLSPDDNKIEEEFKFEDNGNQEEKIRRTRCVNQLNDLASKIKKELQNLREIGINGILEMTSKEDRQLIKRELKKAVFDIETIIQLLLRSKN